MSKLLWEPFFEAVMSAAQHERVLIARASEIVREAIAAGELKARCLARRRDPRQKAYIDIHCELDPRWLDFVAYDNPAENHLRFDPAAAARARLQGEDVRPPEHAREITVDAARRVQLWPEPDALPAPETVEVVPILPAVPVSGPDETDKPKPKGAKRINEKRYKIAEALPTLVIAPDWHGLGILQRCRCIEQHFNQKAGWCPERTYYRAVKEYEKARLTIERSATSAT
jgi:hypothetical protein